MDCLKPDFFASSALFAAKADPAFSLLPVTGSAQILSRAP